MTDVDRFKNTLTSELLEFLAGTPRAEPEQVGRSDNAEAYFELQRRGMVGAHDAAIGWDDDDRARVTKVQVEPVDRLPSLQCLENLRGATIEEGWPHKPTATPAAVFVHMMESGFADSKEMVQALAGFANIIECDWARELHTSAMQLIDPDYDRDADNLEYESMYRAGAFDTMRKDYP